MKNTIFAIACLLLLQSAHAQGKNDAAAIAAEWTIKMNEWLSLPADKQAKLNTINEKALKDVGAAFAGVKGNSSASRDDKKAAAKKAFAAMEERDVAIKSLLSAEEYKLYEAHKLENKAMMQTKMMSKQLDLAPEQEEQIEAINLEALKSMPDIPPAEVLQKMGKIEKLQLGKKMKKVNDQKEDKYKSVLTPEQMQQYLDAKEERKEGMQDRRKDG